MKISIRLYLAAILSIGICYISLAQSIVTDRPDQTESAVSVPKGSMQIETGFIMAYETVK